MTVEWVADNMPRLKPNSASGGASLSNPFNPTSGTESEFTARVRVYQVTNHGLCSQEGHRAIIGWWQGNGWERVGELSICVLPFILLAL